MMQILKDCVVLFCLPICFAITEAYEKTEDYKEQFNNLLTNIADVNKKRLDALKEFSKLSDYSVHSGLRSGEKEPIVAYINVRDLPRIQDKNNDISKEFQESNVKVENSRTSREDLQNMLHVFNDIVFNDDEPTNQDLKDKAFILEDKNELNIEKGREFTLEDENDDFDEEELILDENDDFKESLSEELDNSLRYGTKCRRRAYKLCMNVCRATRRRVCRSYSCSRRIRRAIMSTCRSYCRKAFRYY